MAINNLSIKDNVMKGVKSTGDNYLPTKGRYV